MQVGRQLWIGAPPFRFLVHSKFCTLSTDFPHCLPLAFLQNITRCHRPSWQSMQCSSQPSRSAVCGKAARPHLVAAGKVHAGHAEAGRCRVASNKGDRSAVQGQLLTIITPPVIELWCEHLLVNLYECSNCGVLITKTCSGSTTGASRGNPGKQSNSHIENNNLFHLWFSRSSDTILSTEWLSSKTWSLRCGSFLFPNAICGHITFLTARKSSEWQVL